MNQITLKSLKAWKLIRWNLWFIVHRSYILSIESETIVIKLNYCRNQGWIVFLMKIGNLPFQFTIWPDKLRNNRTSFIYSLVYIVINSSFLEFSHFLRVLSKFWLPRFHFFFVFPWFEIVIESWQHWNGLIESSLFLCLFHGGI